MGYKYCIHCKKYTWFYKDPITNKYYCEICEEWYDNNAEKIRNQDMTNLDN